MNTAEHADELIQNWKVLSVSKAELVKNTAEACIGWPYVYGEWGAYCTVSVRRSRSNGIAQRMPDESKVILNTCQVLRASKPQPDCKGCKYYPDGKKVRCFDCRGFTHWVLEQAGIDIKGQGATSQWDTNTNWLIKGPISQMPKDKVCVVFMWDSKKQNMSHTGLHIGNGDIVHCSGEVKRGRYDDRGWTHYAIPNGMEGEVPVTEQKPTLRKGSRGEYVTLLQTKLLQLGYSLEPYGPDGIFGNKTVEAVKAFQKSHNLAVDGIVGRNTWAALDDAASEPKPEPVRIFYTVTLPHLDYETACELKQKYGGSIDAEK